MAYVITPDEIDFAAYERETDAQQKVKPASQYVQELIDRIRNPIKAPRALMPWHKTHNLIQFRPGEVTCWGGANGNGKSLVTGQVGLSLCAQDEKVGLASKEKALPIRLSGGEQQRLCIARAVVHRPAILLADEPSANLDRAYALDIMELFKSFHQVGVTVVISAHDESLMADYASRILRLSNGQFAA